MMLVMDQDLQRRKKVLQRSALRSDHPAWLWTLLLMVHPARSNKLTRFYPKLPCFINILQMNRGRATVYNIFYIQGFQQMPFKLALFILTTFFWQVLKLGDFEHLLYFLSTSHRRPHSVTLDSGPIHKTKAYAKQEFIVWVFRHNLKYDWMSHLMTWHNIKKIK